jgi:maleate cis-trans isomerase
MNGTIMNVVVFACTSAITVLGVGYFCVDLYRNRNKRLSHFEAIADVTGLESSPAALNIENEIAHQTAHGVAEASHNVGESLGNCVEAIAHTLSHH